MLTLKKIKIDEAGMSAAIRMQKALEKIKADRERKERLAAPYVPVKSVFKQEKPMKESNEHYEEAEEHLSKANDAEAKGHMKSFHAHMADHHDAMSEWHDSKGRSASADKHADKAEYHHEKSLTVKESFRPMDEPKYDQSIQARQKKADDAKKNAAKTAKEEVDLSELNKDTVYSYARKADKDQDKQSNITNKAIKANDSKTANKAHHKFTMRAVGIDRAETRLNKEEQIKELSTQLLQRYKDKARKSVEFNVLEEAVKALDSGEYDYEGQMARTQLQTTLRNCEDLIDMIKDNDNMPEWVQSKITLAQDYITTVRDYLQSKEELGEELSDPTRNAKQEKDISTGKKPMPKRKLLGFKQQSC